MEKIRFLTKNKISQLPETSGVYIFKNNKKFLYIGKAVNIKERVKNHFQQLAYKDNLFLNKVHPVKSFAESKGNSSILFNGVKRIGFIKTNSDIEALILEANLIKKYQPKFNVLWRDDKNYFYVAITKEKYPRVFITHQPKKISNFQLPISNYIGPFIEGVALKKTLRFLRRVFPYYTVRRHPKNLCTYCHLRLCPGPNPDFKNYKNNIKNLIAFFGGKKKSVLKKLRKEMKIASKVQDFEKAAKIRDKILALEKILAHTKIIIPSEISQDDWYITQRILQKIIRIKKEISRIEAYDISNIQGRQATGSMVVFVKGQPEKSSYRKFKIKNTEKPNDVGMLKETLKRRLNHPEWPYPDLILLDGGKAQLNAAENLKSQISPVSPSLSRSTGRTERANLKSIKLLSLVKKKNELYIEGERKPTLLKKLPREIFNLILQLSDEAHRFAKSYHYKLRRIDLWQKI